jgi:hypothetical protein
VTTEELADQHRVRVGILKALLRRGFPDGGDFRPPGKTLEAEHVRYVNEHLPEFLQERKARGEDVAATVEDRPPPDSVAALAPAPRSDTARMPRAGGEHHLLVHEEVSDFLADPLSDRRLKAAVKRLMREMLVEGRSPRRVKGTRGVNAGWLRAPLGDNGGYHYYLFHGLQGLRPMHALELAREEVVLRAVRHHDETGRPLDAGARGDYVRIDAREYVELFEPEASDADVLSEHQRTAFRSAASASITKGHPGAGKTTLQLERTRRVDGRLLFLTFGAAQRDEAEKWLRTYAPEDLELLAWTHEALFRALDPGWAPSLPAGEAIAVLARELQGVLPRLGPWRNHMAALHAELRAHYWGRALPIAFRDTAAGVDAATRERAYRERRTLALGEAAVEAVLHAADALSPTTHRQLFGDLERAGRIAEALAARGAAALPEDLRALGAILVDEVQDLTLVEALVCVLVAHAAARGRGTRPSFHAAGDEGQTVRATDFDWGELKDLVGLLLAAPEEFTLPGNVRSPKTLTRIVNRSWDLYKAFAKTHRPRGYAEAEVDESAVGSVLWVEAGQDLGPVLAAIARIPGAALVYPDVRVPPEVREAAQHAGVLLTLGAPEAKGLGFRVVFVLDAGRLAHKVWSAMPQVPSRSAEAVIEIESRLVVDSIRVAISRSTEVLVFVERELDEHVRRRLESLCSDEDGLFEGVVTDASIERLEALVDLDTADRTELVTELLADFAHTFADDPAAGLRIAERARQWLGDSNRTGAVQGRLRQEVYGAHGRALLRVATTGSGTPAEVGGMLRRANAAFNLAEEKELARLCLDARDALAESAGADKIERIVQRAMDASAPGAAEALAVLRSFVRGAEARADEHDRHGWSRLLDALDAMDAPAAQHPDLAAARQRLVERAARWALEAGREGAKLAARALERMAEQPVDLRARVAERQQRWAEAIELFKLAGMPGVALRISRARGDDPRRSAELAGETGDDARPILERLARIHAELAALDADALTDAEREHLTRSVQDRFARQKRSRR